MNVRLQKQIDFIMEIDKIKSIFRQTRLLDGSRYENDAEHAWHLSMMCLVLFEYAEEKIDMLRTLKMLLIHDIVEIDAGDTFLYEPNSSQAKQEKEMEAAKRIFGLLPDAQREEFQLLWMEFEERKSPEAKFAAALDRLEPVMQNSKTEGHAWRKHGISKRQVLDKNKPVISDGSKRLWEFAEQLIDATEEKGYLKA